MPRWTLAAGCQSSYPTTLTRTRLTGLGNSVPPPFSAAGAGTGLLTSETHSLDPLGHTVATAYDAEGHVLAQRGVTHPVDYAYDAYGNKVAMTTYRQEPDDGGLIEAALPAMGSRRRGSRRRGSRR